MALPKLSPAPEPATQPPLIGILRLAALACRAAPRSSVQACLLLDPEADAGAHATVLARMLPEALVRRPVLWRPGTRSRSFDEDWLLALAGAMARGDRTSERFLMARRVRPEAALALRLALGGLCARLARPGDPVARKSIPPTRRTR